MNILVFNSLVKYILKTIHQEVQKLEWHLILIWFLLRLVFKIFIEGKASEPVKTKHLQLDIF